MSGEQLTATGPAGGTFSLMLALEVLGRSGREPFRPAAWVLDVALVSRTGRWVVCGAWLWIGFHFLAR